MSGILYIVPTPIGNLEDITLRALRILKHASLIAAEDTRTSRVLLDHYEIKNPLTSYHEHNKLTKLETVFDALTIGDVALISDAGTPGISDPGYELIGEAIKRGVKVVPLPGANAVITALVASGLPTDSFVYLGFLPRKKLEDFLQTLSHERRTMIAYENPYRLVSSLEAIQRVFGEKRQVVVARELTKMFEEFKRGTVAEVLAHFREENPRGEITLLIGGVIESDKGWDETRVREALAERIADGDSLSSAAKAIAKVSGWKKSAIYDLGLES